MESIFFYKTAQSILLVCEVGGLCRSYCTFFKENGVILIPFSLKTAQTTWMVCEAHSLHSPYCAGHIVQYYCQCVRGLTHHSGSLCSFQRKWYQNDTVFFENCAIWPAQTSNLTHQSNRLCSFIKENGFQKYHRTCY